MHDSPDTRAALIRSAWASVEERQNPEVREAVAAAIEDLVASGKKVAFLTLGDPLLYSTYIHFIGKFCRVDFVHLFFIPRGLFK